MRTVLRLVVTAGAILFCLLAGGGVANALPWEASSVPAPCMPPVCGQPAADPRPCPPPFCGQPAADKCAPPHCENLRTATHERCALPHCDNLAAVAHETCPPPFCSKADPAPAVCSPPWCPVAQAPGTIRQAVKQLACYPPRCADG